MQIPSLDEPAWGPFRMAAMLRRPIVLLLGLHRGGRRYEIVFEAICAESANEPVEAAMLRYVARLEHHCRRPPYNWFNFYEFWVA